MAINDESVLNVTTAWACIRLLADTVSTLPSEAMVRVDGERRPWRPRPQWMLTPNPSDVSLTWQGLMSQVMVSLLVDGNAFVHTTRDDAGEVLGLLVLDPRSVTIHTAALGSAPYYTVQGVDNHATFDTSEILHIPLLRHPGQLRGLSPIDQCREALGVTAAAQDFQGRFFSQGTSTTGIIEYPGDMSADQQQALADHWAALHTGKANSHKAAVLTGGASFKPLSLTADQMQLLQLRAFQRSDVCAIWRVPAALVQDNQPGAVSYASVEQQALSFEKHTIRPLVSLVEGHFSRITPGRSWLRLSMEGLLRGDQKTRFEAFATALNNGWMSVNEIRAYEDQRAIDHESANMYRMPLNMGDQEAAGLAMLKARAEIAAKLVATGFDPDQAAVIAGLAIDHTGIPPSALQQLQALDPDDPLASYQREVSNAL